MTIRQESTQLATRLTAADVLVAERVVRQSATDVAEARTLFEMLGLVDGPNGRELVLPPGDPSAGGTRPAPDDVVLHERPLPSCTTPPGLAHLPPVAPAAPPRPTSEPREPRATAKRTPKPTAAGAAAPVIDASPAADRPVPAKTAPKRKPKPAKAAKAKPTVTRQPEPPREPRRQRVAACGSTSGAGRHYRLGEKPCPACRAASNARQREYDQRRRRRAKMPKKPTAVHGTRGGYSAHRRDRTPPCQPCKDAEAAYAREYTRKVAAAAGRTVRPRAAVAQCGTPSGYKRHRRLGETACASCRQARQAAEAAYRPKRRTATVTHLDDHRVARTEGSLKQVQRV